MNPLSKAIGHYNIQWGEELIWAIFMAFATGAAQVFLAGQGTMDRTTFLSAVVAAGARPALALVGTRVTAVVGKLTAVSTATPQRYLPYQGGIMDTQTGATFWPVQPVSTTSSSAPPVVPPSIGGNV